MTTCDNKVFVHLIGGWCRGGIWEGEGGWVVGVMTCPREMTRCERWKASNTSLCLKSQSHFASGGGGCDPNCELGQMISFSFLLQPGRRVG